MAEGFIQVAPDGSGKQLDNDVITIPAGTVLTDGSGNQTTLSAPAYYFRERIVNADPNDPVGLAAVRNASGPLANDYALSVRMPPGQADLQTIAALLLDIDNNIAALAGTVPLASIGQITGSYAYPVAGMPPGIQSPGTPRQQVCDIFGRLLVVPHATREAVTPTNITITVSTAQTLIAAGDANTFNDLVAVIGANTSATATRVDISDGTQTIPLYLPAGDTRGISLGGVLIKASATATAWTATCSVAVTDVRVWALYVSNKIR